MGREVRRVPADWQHPLDYRGRYKRLHEGKYYEPELFLRMANEKGLQAALEEFGAAPNKEDYMPLWSEEEATHYQMYENVSEGTPISPPMASPETLAQWLADNDANAGAGGIATYHAWLAICKGGYAPSMILTKDGLMNGVEGAYSMKQKGGEE